MTTKEIASLNIKLAGAIESGLTHMGKAQDYRRKCAELESKNADMRDYIKTLTAERDVLKKALETTKDALEQLRHKAWQKAYPAEQLRANTAIHTIDEALKGMK